MSLKSAFYTVVLIISVAMAALCLVALAGCSSQKTDASPAELGQKDACCDGDAKDCCANNPGKACCEDEHKAPAAK